MGFVYFIREKDYNAYKIGCSSTKDNVESRLVDLQVGNSRKLEVFGLIECEDWIEKESEIQCTWDNLNIRGEWYEFTEAQATILLKAYGGIISPEITDRSDKILIANEGLEAICKKKLEGSIDISVRRIAASLGVKKWEVEAMLKSLQNKS